MSRAVERTVKSTQEQAVASWITYLNQVRLNEFIERLDRQDINFEEAMAELAELKAFIGDPAHILGSELTKHGEIAEHMQVNISNARNAIKGLMKEYTFDGVGRTAPEDYLKNGQKIQSKFYNGLKGTIFNHHGLKDHLNTYPDFVKNGGSYDIPKDQYGRMLEILKKYKEHPSKLSTSDYQLAKQIDEFLKESGLELGKDIKPAVVEYRDSQLGVADKTVAKEEENIKTEDKEQRKEAYEKAQPSLKEGVKASGVSAAIEGGMAFCIAVAKKRKEKNLADFTEEDWKEIGIDTGKGTVKGGIRGGAVYVLTNFTATPGNVASAYVTAAFGVAAQIKELHRGKISEEDFVINCETVCLDVSVSAIAALAGTALIPIPVLGTVIGTVVGEFIYELCKKEGAEKSLQIAEGYRQDIKRLEQQLTVQLYGVVLDIQTAIKRFNDLETLAFDEDINKAFIGSIQLAEEVGVKGSQILRSKEQVNNYFMS